MSVLAPLLLLLAFAAAPARAGGDVDEAIAASFKAFQEGRLDEAESGYRYLIGLGVAAPDPDPNLAILSRDAGKGDSALALWVKTSLVDGADGFLWNQRGWAYLALDRLKEARESFVVALDRSTSTASQAETRLGTAMSHWAEDRPKAALPMLREALGLSPYLIPIVAYQSALNALAMGDKHGAMAYLRQAIEVDIYQREALQELARMYQKLGQNKAAWRAYHRLLSWEPTNEEASQAMKKMAPFLGGDVENLMPTRRLVRPMLELEGKGLEPASPSSATLRVGLYSLDDGTPATIVRLYFMTNAPYKMISSNGEVVREDGKAYDQWQLIFRLDTGVVEVRDVVNNIQFATKQPFSIVPEGRLATVLVKSASASEQFGFEPGDRELRGRLEIFPTPYGFKLVNEVRLEDYLQSVTASALPHGSPLETYKALAVLARTRALKFMADHPATRERIDIADSSHGQAYLGLSEEMRVATRAVLDTEGVYLRFAGAPADVLAHRHCGGITQAGIHDGPAPAAPWRTPMDLERFVREYPPRDRYCEAGTSYPAADARWSRVIDAYDLQPRVDKLGLIGTISHMRVLRRADTGRVTALEVRGPRGSVAIEGERAIADFLSPGSLRSTFFTIQAMRKGGKTRRFILWGAGTGHGRGLCLAGAVGQGTLGRQWHEILAHYYPRFEVVHPRAAKAKAAAKPSAPGRYKHKNPKRKKL